MRIILALISTVILSTSAAADLCKDVKVAIDNEKDNWTANRAAYDNISETYESTLVISGFEQCFIEDDAELPRFTCTMNVADEATANRQGDSLFAQVKACMGNKPLKTRSQKYNSSNKFHDAQSTLRIIELGVERIELVVSSGRRTRIKTGATTFSVKLSVKPL